jgi:thiol:disulfide interchange protein DsbD
MSRHCFFKWLLLLPLLGVPGPVYAQGDERMETSVTLDPKEAVAGGNVTAKVKLDVKLGFHTYPTKQKDPGAAGFVTSFSIRNEDKAPVEIKGEVKEPIPHDSLQGDLSVSKFEEPVELEVPLRIKPTTPVGKAKFSFVIQTQVCDDKGCLPYSKTYELEVMVKEGQAPPAPTGTPEKAATPEVPAVAPVSTLAKPVVSTKTDEETNLSFMLRGIGFGWITLFTPCVFPMIPITVSFFLKQEKEGQKAIFNASLYAGTIIVAMTIIAFAFVGTFQTLTQRWPTNFILGALFIYFALSLFGMYEITLPGFLTRWTSAGEAKGGYLGTIFMALTFTIISFSCVAPFLGGFAGVSAGERPIGRTLLGAVGFAVAFAAPFFVLALFPTMLKKLPKSGNWLNSMKVVMGFLEIAAALKFLRAAELLYYGEKPTILTYDLVLGLYVTLCLLTGLYLIGVYKLPHDEAETRKIGVGRLLWSFVFLGLGFYLLPGLFHGSGSQHRPSGAIYAWVDAFLLPDPESEPVAAAGSTKSGAKVETLHWVGFLDQALARAKEKKQRIFIDFTGET